MYNSDEQYTSEEQNRFNQSNDESTDSRRIDMRPQSRPKNQISNIAFKPNGISGTYTRIIPRRPVHDYEKLYAENIQLKEKIRSLEDMFLKTKTRMSMMEKEKDQLRMQVKASDNYEVLKPRKPSQKGLTSYNQKMKRHTNDQNRRILHEYKDQITRLETENNRLKKVVKYTQIQELQTENNLLHEQMARMKEYMEDVINNTEYDDYEREIEHLNKLLQQEKQSVRSMHTRLKKKDEEMEEVKQKMKAIASRKTELQKRLNRQISTYKGELYKARERERDFYLVSNHEQKKQSLRFKKESSKNCHNCLEHQKTIENLNNQSKQNKKVIEDKNREIKELMVQVRTLEEEIKNKKQQESFQKQMPKEQKKPAKVHLKSEENHPKDKPIEKQKSPPKQASPPKEDSIKKGNEKEENYEEYDDEDLFDDDDSDIEELGADSNDKVDMMHVKLKNKTEKEEDVQKNKTEKDDQMEQYEAEFQENESEEEVLFQKDQKPKEKKQKGKGKKNQKEKGKQKEKEKEKEKEKGNSSKAQKILKQTVRYRLIGQRYVYSDFERDIIQSNATEFGIQDLIDMLSNEPFILHEEHLEMLLIKCLGKNEFSEEDSISTEKFIKVIKPYFDDVTLLDEDDERSTNTAVRNKIKKRKEVVIEALSVEGNGEDISKKSFVKILSDMAKLNNKEVQMCLADASVISKDIAHINYLGFLQSMLETQE